jgi:hypothetical protein
MKAFPDSQASSGLDLLAEAAMMQVDQEQPGPSSSRSSVSPILFESLKLPKAVEPPKPVRKTLTNILPDNLTSEDSIRTFSLKQIEKVKAFAEKERKAKEKFIKQKSKQQCPSKKKGSRSQSAKGKMPKTAGEKLKEDIQSHDNKDVCCEACHMTYKEDEQLGLGRVWVECDLCQKWMHTECLNYEIDDNEPFLCPKCYKD